MCMYTYRSTPSSTSTTAPPSRRSCRRRCRARRWRTLSSRSSPGIHVNIYNMTTISTTVIMTIYPLILLVLLALTLVVMLLRDGRCREILLNATPRRGVDGSLLLSCAIYTHTPARKILQTSSCTILLYTFVLQTGLGMGIGINGTAQLL